MFLLSAAILQTGCIKQKSLYMDKEDKEEGNGGNGGTTKPEEPIYQYPFGQERTNATATLTIRMENPIDANQLQARIPELKYNKEWLLMITQDDCTQSTYCRTWAHINGKPVASSQLYPTDPDRERDFYYHAAQLRKNDFPPTVFPAGKTLGITDGTGKEVRFATTATVIAEDYKMSRTVNADPGFTGNFYRFYRDDPLVWEDVAEMLNYGFGMAFHNVNANEQSPVSITEHFGIAQDIIKEKLSGRICKTLAEPDGNKNYIEAANSYAPIQAITAQAKSVDIYPFKVDNDLQKVVQTRYFNDSPDYFKQMIETENNIPDFKERKAIHIGLHNTDDAWCELFTWINDTYGKDGDNSVWVPNLEEYYEL